MKNTAVRIAIVILVVVTVHLGFYVVRAGTRPAEVKLPGRSLESIPRQIGGWQGSPEELNHEIFVNTGAREVLPRRYLNRQGQRVSAFVALYTNAEEGVYHSPTNCYRSSGWNLLEISRPLLKTKGRPDTPVSFSTWEQKGDRIYVLYWYELGDYTLFERSDLLKVRWGMLGKRVWPPMYKVLLQTSAPDAETARTRLLEFAEVIRTTIPELDAEPAPGAAAPAK